MPFLQEIERAKLPQSMSMPKLPKYDGATDPENHFCIVESSLIVYGLSDEMKCQALPETLTGAAFEWYKKLERRSIHSFDQLAQGLIDRFTNVQNIPKTSATFFQLNQGVGESLREFTRRYNEAALQVSDPNDAVAIIAYAQGLASSEFKDKVGRGTYASFAEIIKEAKDFIKGEDVKAATTPALRGEGRSSHEYASKSQDNPSSSKGKAKMDLQRPPLQPRFERFIPLTKTRTEVLALIQKDRSFPWPPKTASNPDRRDRSQYCQNHQDHGHSTKECRSLKEEIESFVQRGRLNQFVAKGQGGFGGNPSRSSGGPLPHRAGGSMSMS